MIILAVLIGSTLMPLIPSGLKAQTIITLKARGTVATKNELTVAAKVIEGRLHDFTGKEVACNLEEDRITFRLDGSWNQELIGQLITRKGEMNVYEIPDRTTVLGLLPAGSPLRARITGSAGELNGPELLCVDQAETETVKKELGKTGPDQQLAWVWTYPQSGKCCLYALRANGSSSPVFSSSPVASARIGGEEKTERQWVEIRFSSQAASQWAGATKRNIGHWLAMVIDQKVVCSPMVRDEIKGGNCAITGNFTSEEMAYMTALLNNGVLPLELEVAGN
jgi:preprotein translocase subunit SecD